MSKDCRAPQGQYHEPTGRGQAGRALLNPIIPEAAGYEDGEQQDLKGTLLLLCSIPVLRSRLFSFEIVRRLGLVPQTLVNALNAVSLLGTTVKKDM